jgi:hypothetical protein
MVWMFKTKCFRTIKANIQPVHKNQSIKLSHKTFRWKNLLNLRLHWIKISARAINMVQQIKANTSTQKTRRKSKTHIHSLERTLLKILALQANFQKKWMRESVVRLMTQTQSQSDLIGSEKNLCHQHSHLLCIKTSGKQTLLDHKESTIKHRQRSVNLVQVSASNLKMPTPECGNHFTN